MALNTEVGIKLNVNSKELESALASVLNKFKELSAAASQYSKAEKLVMKEKMLALKAQEQALKQSASDVKVNEAEKLAAIKKGIADHNAELKKGLEQERAARKQHTEAIVTDARSVGAVILATEKKTQTARLELEKKSTTAIIAEMKVLQDTKKNLQTEYENSLDRADKNRLAKEKQAIQQRLRLLDSEAKNRKEVLEGGAGGRVGILGTGRSIFGGPDYAKEIKKLQSEAKTIRETMVKDAQSADKKELESKQHLINAEIKELERLKSEQKKTRSEAISDKLSSLPGMSGAGGSGIGSMLSSAGPYGMVAAGAVAAVGAGIAVGIEGFKKLKEAAQQAEQASDQLYIGLSRSGLKGSVLNYEFTRLSSNAKKLAIDFAMPREEVMKVQATIAGLGGTAGAQLDKVTELAIGVSNATGLAVENVARIIAKGTDPSVEGGMSRLGVAVSKNADMQERMNVLTAKYGATIDATKERMKEGTHSWDGMINRVQMAVQDFSAPIFREIGPIFDKASPYLEKLTRIFGDVLHKAVTKVLAILRELHPEIEQGKRFVEAYGKVFIASVVVALQKGVHAAEWFIGAMKSVEHALSGPLKLISKVTGSVGMVGSSALGGLGIGSEGSTVADPAMDAQVAQTLKANAAADKSAGGGKSKTAEQIAKEHFEKQEQVIRVWLADKQTLLNKSNESDEQIAEDGRKLELHSLWLQLANAQKYGQDVSQLRLQISTKEREILKAGNEATLKEQKASYAEQLREVDEAYTAIDEKLDLKLAGGVLSQRKYDEIRYNNDLESLTVQLKFIEDAGNKESEEWKSVNQKREALIHAQAVKTASNNKSDADEKLALEESLEQKLLQTKAHTIDGQIALEDFRHKQELERIAKFYKDKAGFEKDKQAEELVETQTHYANLNTVHENAVASWVAPAFQSAYSVMDKDFLSKVIDRFLKADNVAGAFFSNLIHHELDAIQATATKKFTEWISSIVFPEKSAAPGVASDASDAVKIGGKPIPKYLDGTSDTGSGGLAILHPHEAVLPAGAADRYAQFGGDAGLQTLLSLNVGGGGLIAGFKREGYKPAPLPGTGANSQNAQDARDYLRKQGEAIQAAIKVEEEKKREREQQVADAKKRQAAHPRNTRTGYANMEYLSGAMARNSTDRYQSMSGSGDSQGFEDWRQRSGPSVEMLKLGLLGKQQQQLTDIHGTPNGPGALAGLAATSIAPLAGPAAMTLLRLSTIADKQNNLTGTNSALANLDAQYGTNTDKDRARGVKGVDVLKAETKETIIEGFSEIAAGVVMKLEATHGAVVHPVSKSISRTLEKYGLSEELSGKIAANAAHGVTHKGTEIGVGEVAKVTAGGGDVASEEAGNKTAETLSKTSQQVAQFGNALHGITQKSLMPAAASKALGTGSKIAGIGSALLGLIPGGSLLSGTLGGIASLFGGAAGFADGGYTGIGGMLDKNGQRVTGVVHEDEFVQNSKTVRKYGLGTMEAMRKGTFSPNVTRPVFHMNGGSAMNMQPMHDEIKGLRSDIRGLNLKVDSGGIYTASIVGSKAAKEITLG